MTTILLDCDGPLANFCDGFLALVEEETGRRFDASSIVGWDVTKCPYFEDLARELGVERKELSDRVWKRVTRIGFCQSLKPVEGAIDAVKLLREFAHVEVVTSPLGSSPTWMPERVEWLGRHFGFDSSEVHFVQKKFRVHGDVLVDDKPSHIREWAAATHVEKIKGHAVLWDAPYNRDESFPEATRVRGWSEAVDFLKERFDKRLKTLWF